MSNEHMMTQREWDRLVGWGAVPEENDLGLDESQFFRRHDDPPKRRVTQTYAVLHEGNELPNLGGRQYEVDFSRHRFDD